MLIGSLFLSMTGCAGSQPAACVPGTGKPMQVYQLYFGRTITGGGFVSEQDWNTFREAAITPNLPDGYTILDADGAWAAPGRQRTVTDPTKVLIVAIPPGQDGVAAVTRVRLDYQHRFAQELVGMIVLPGCALF